MRWSTQRALRANAIVAKGARTAGTSSEVEVPQHKPQLEMVVAVSSPDVERFLALLGLGRYVQRSSAALDSGCAVSPPASRTRSPAADWTASAATNTMVASDKPIPVNRVAIHTNLNAGSHPRRSTNALCVARSEPPNIVIVPNTANRFILIWSGMAPME